MDNAITLKQPQAVTFAKYRLNVHEHRILIRIIEVLQPEVNDFFKGKKALVSYQNNLFGDKIITIPTRLLLPPKSNNYACVKNALKALKEKTITIKGQDKEGKYETYTGIILRAKYYESNAKVEITLCKELMPVWLDLSRGYTEYLLSIAFNLSSAYAIRLYQQMSHWTDTGSKILYFDELKECLGLGKKYKESSQFKQSILTPIMQELKDKADVWFDIAEAIKEGRKVVGWRFSIYSKRKGPTRPLKTSVLPSQEKVIQKLTHEFKLSARQARIVADKVSHKALYKVLHAIQLLKINHKLSNVGGYTAKLLTEKFNLKL